MARFVSALAMTLACSMVAGAQSNPPIFPMEKGTTWVYSARVKWGGTGTKAGGVRTITWTSTVVDAYGSGDISAALLHGGPWDLAWYSPQQTKPEDYLIVRAGDAYFLVAHEARAKFAEVKSATAGDIAKQFADDLWFRVPLEIGDTYCAPDQEKTAPFYCWSVEKITRTHSLRLSGFHPKEATEYYLAFLTNPDSTFLTLVPGAGIISYEYEHHGTVAEASVKLIRMRSGTRAPAGVAHRKARIQTRKVE